MEKENLLSVYNVTMKNNHTCYTYKQLNEAFINNINYFFDGSYNFPWFFSIETINGLTDNDLSEIDTIKKTRKSFELYS